MKFEVVGWRRIIFSNEKSFNLDGPHGSLYCQHICSKEPGLFSKHKNNGGEIMVWGAISKNGKIPLLTCSEKIGAKRYIAASEESKAFDAAEKLLGIHFEFQHGNALIHVPTCTQEHLDSNQVRVLPWPAKSSGLIPTENVLALMKNEVHRAARQYYSLQHLESVIWDAWVKIKQDASRKLCKGMFDRMFYDIWCELNYIEY